MFKKVPTIVIDEEPEDDITYPTAKRPKHDGAAAANDNTEKSHKAGKIKTRTL